MKYKYLTAIVVLCCMLSGAALMAYVDYHKKDLNTPEQIEVKEEHSTKKKHCKNLS